jgi:Ca-activated chloride channel family protein
MLHFAHPWLLLLLLGVPPLIWWWLRRRGSALRFPTVGFLTGLPVGRGKAARWGGAGMRAAALTALALAAAGPRWPDLRSRIETEGIAIAMIVDASGSMAETDFEWQGQRISRLEAVKRAFGLFVAGGEGPDGSHLDGRPNDLIGVVTFATRPETTCPLTLSHSVLLHMLEGEQPRSVPTESETNIGDALAWGLQTLESAGARRKIVILLSDGEHNVPPPALKPRQAAQLAANLRIPIYVIDAGGDNGGAQEPDKKKPPADQMTGPATLRVIAQLTGGRYFPARDAQSLLHVCSDIDRLERQEIQSFQYRRYYEAAMWFGLASFTLLAGVRLLEATVWHRVP